MRTVPFWSRRRCSLFFFSGFTKTDEDCSVLVASSAFSFLLVCMYVSLGSTPDPNGREKRTNSRRVRLRLSCSAPDPNGREKTTNIRRVRLCLSCSAPDPNGREKTTNILRVRLRLLCSAPDLSGCQRTTNIRRVRLRFLRSSARPERM